MSEDGLSIHNRYQRHVHDTANLYCTVVENFYLVMLINGHSAGGTLAPNASIVQ
jgi:hypothetical protein